MRPQNQIPARGGIPRYLPFSIQASSAQGFMKNASGRKRFKRYRRELRSHRSESLPLLRTRLSPRHWLNTYSILRSWTAIE